jgi:hypothetical protein
LKRRRRKASKWLTEIYPFLGTGCSRLVAFWQDERRTTPRADFTEVAQAEREL